jgi:mRNA export factor
MFDVVTGQSSQVGEHGEPIKEIKFADIAGAGGVLITGSWDKTVKVRKRLYTLFP